MTDHPFSAGNEEHLGAMPSSTPTEVARPSAVPLAPNKLSTGCFNTMYTKAKSRRAALSRIWGVAVAAAPLLSANEQQRGGTA